MCKLKKLLSILIALSLFTTATLPVFASPNAPTYNPILEKIGITEDAFWAMPPEKRVFYQDVQEITSISSSTKYYKLEEVSCETENLLSDPIEVTEKEYVNATTPTIQQARAVGDLIDTDEASGTWYKMTTTVSEMAVTSGERHLYVANRIELNQYAMGILNTGRSGFLGVSLNSNTSPISGSEMLTLEFSYITEPEKRYTYYYDTAPYKGCGYAFDIGVGPGTDRRIYTMTFMAMPNTSASLTVFEGYGFAGYWTGSLSASINIGPFGSITFGSTSNVVRANNTHAQIYLNR